MYPSKQSLLVRLYPNSQFCQTQNAAQNQACFLGEKKKKKDLQTILNALIIFFLYCVIKCKVNIKTVCFHSAVTKHFK